jgi:fructokinase
MQQIYGGIEAGGTKFVCAVGTGPDDLRDEVRFPTTTPEETIGRAIDYFKSHAERDRLAAIGVAAFGPVDPNPDSATFGTITTTPKPGWRQTDFAGAVGRELGLPVGFDTDVNGAALGEWRWGAARGLDSVLYATIGTGVGGGLAVRGRPLHGLIHPEMGHMRLPHDLERDPFEGCCPFHGDCLEGLACGKAIEERWGESAENLPDDHDAWDLEAEYLGLACHNWICTLSPQRIILGGGVMENLSLLPRVRERTQALLADYVQAPELLTGIEHYIVRPGLGNRAGILGALVLAAQAVGRE